MCAFYRRHPIKSKIFFKQLKHRAQCAFTQTPQFYNKAFLCILPNRSSSTTSRSRPIPIRSSLTSKGTPIKSKNTSKGKYSFSTTKMSKKSSTTPKKSLKRESDIWSEIVGTPSGECSRGSSGGSAGGGAKVNENMSDNSVGASLSKLKGGNPKRSKELRQGSLRRQSRQ